MKVVLNVVYTGSDETSSGQYDTLLDMVEGFEEMAAIDFMSTDEVIDTLDFLFVVGRMEFDIGVASLEFFDDVSQTPIAFEFTNIRYDFYREEIDKIDALPEGEAFISHMKMRQTLVEILNGEMTVEDGALMLYPTKT